MTRPKAAMRLLVMRKDNEYETWAMLTLVNPLPYGART